MGSKFSMRSARIRVRLAWWKNTVSVMTELPRKGSWAMSSAHWGGALGPKSASKDTAMRWAAARSRTPRLAQAVAWG